MFLLNDLHMLEEATKTRIRKVVTIFVTCRRRSTSNHMVPVPRACIHTMCQASSKIWLHHGVCQPESLCPYREWPQIMVMSLIRYQLINDTTHDWSLHDSTVALQSSADDGRTGPELSLSLVGNAHLLVVVSCVHISKRSSFQVNYAGG